MFKKITMSLLCLASAIVWTAGASASVRVGPRYDWFYGRGYFHAVAGAGGGWVETIDANEAFYFQQTDRNEAYVELYDGSRDVHVRLYGTAMYFKGPGEAQFRPFYDGHWDDRRLFTYTLPGSGPNYFNLKTAEIWHWARPGLPILYMRETLRNNDQIQLYNGAEGLTISLMDNEIWMKKDGFNWFKYGDGAWN